VPRTWSISSKARLFVARKFLQKSYFVRTRLDGIAKKLVQLRAVKSTVTSDREFVSDSWLTSEDCFVSSRLFDDAVIHHYPPLNRTLLSLLKPAAHSTSFR
jgi:hypothetical protein